MKSSRIFLLAALSVVLLLGAAPTAAKDEWIQVKSKNFYLIGNASERDIRKVATRLEQFRETFRQVFGKMNLTSPIATNVVVFKSDSSYKNFKPKRADGKIDSFVAGYFQAGEDVNYITLSTEGEDAETFSVIFHEYVHFIVNTNFGKSEIPPWFNEGLAEYYSTFAIEDDIKAKLGLPLGRHILMLQQSKFMPLSTLFKISNHQLLQTGDHSRSIFYAESWALIHYLIQGGKTDALGKFLNLLLADVAPEKAFQDAFQIGYSQMEGELRKYVGHTQYPYQQISFKSKLLFDADMQASPLDEADSNAYLGDLLYHTNRANDAEPFLLTALILHPDSSLANTTLGMVRIKQRKFVEAKQNLEKAIAGDPKNHIAFYRYAFLLSREGRDEFGFVHAYNKETAAKMREALRKSIALNPTFTESYELLAFVDLVNLEELDDGAKLMQGALKYQPGNQRYALRLAEILSRQNKLDEANLIAEKIARTADDPETKGRAESLVAQIAEHKDLNGHSPAEGNNIEERAEKSGNGPPKTGRHTQGGKQLTEAEAAKLQEQALLRSINESLRKPAEGEIRVIGHVQKIDCRTRPIVFTVKTQAETVTVTSKDFESLALQAFVSAASNAEIGCDANVSTLNSIVTYRPAPNPKGVSRGEITAIEFVPANFRLLTLEEMSDVTAHSSQPTDIPSPPGSSSSSATTPGDLDARRHAAMIQSINEALVKPKPGEKREMGYLDRIECTKKETFFYLRTATRTLKLLNSSPQTLRINVFTPDLEGVQFGCELKPLEFPAVFIYTDKPDAKAKTAGEIRSIEFAPSSFVLDQ